MIDSLHLVLYRANESYVIVRLTGIVLVRSRTAHIYQRLPSRTAPPSPCAVVRG